MNSQTWIFGKAAVPLFVDWVTYNTANTVLVNIDLSGHQKNSNETRKVMFTGVTFEICFLYSYTVYVNKD